VYTDGTYKHTVIDGQALGFEGKGGSLFGKYIIWFLLCLITLGIYRLWIPIKKQQWLTKHIHFVPQAPVRY
jgi:uncharacterized membrane protein YjgN (DUF898 family)